MSAAHGAAQPRPRTSTATVFRRAASAEWTRMWTIRSTWWSLLAATALMLFVGAAAGSSHSGGDPAPIWQPAQMALVPAATHLVAWGFVGQAAEVVPADIAASLGRVALVVAFGSVLTVGLGLLLRSTAGTLTAIFLLVLALPLALGNSGVPALVTISDHRSLLRRDTT